MATSVILASKSPRRKEILETMGVEFEIDVADVDESVDSSLSPVEAVCEISNRKAKAVCERHEGEDVIVISADTVVVIDGKIIGKLFLLVQNENIPETLGYITSP